jgi:hypothetical protein
MMRCALEESPDLELYFYRELGPDDRARVDAHLRVCPCCRQRLGDLEAIGRALDAGLPIDAPAAGDWSGFMRRLDVASGGGLSRAPRHLDRPGLRVGRAIAIAATVALTSVGVFLAARFSAVRTGPEPVVVMPSGASPVMSISSTQSVREVSAEHLERSKLVILGLVTRDPRDTRPADWRYERQLAGTLLSDTRLYRLAAQERGLTDVARVMGDLETVLLETSMSDPSDRGALERVQRLIARRDLVGKMRALAAAGSAGT